MMWEYVICLCAFVIIVFGLKPYKNRQSSHGEGSHS